MTHKLKGRKQTKEHIARRVASCKKTERKLLDMETKLLNKVQKVESGCWNWIGAAFIKPYGNYGQIRIGRKG